MDKPDAPSCERNREPLGRADSAKICREHAVVTAAA